MVPNYIGPHHVLSRIRKAFSFEDTHRDVKKFHTTLKNIQRNTFYNHKVYDEWMAGKITLRHAINTINELIDYDKMNDLNVLPMPSWGITNRRGGDKSYTSVVLIGKFNNSIWDLPEYKKWCWIKNSDGYIYDGEYNPADMNVKTNSSLQEEELIVGSKQEKIKIKYYEMDWAGFQTNIFGMNQDLKLATANIADMKRAQYGYYPKYSQQRVNANVTSSERNNYFSTYGGEKSRRGGKRIKRRNNKRKTHKKK